MYSGTNYREYNMSDHSRGWKGCAEESGTTGSRIPETELFPPRLSRSGKWSKDEDRERRV